MKSSDENTTWHRHSSHWGGFNAQVREGRLVGVSGFEQDPHPSPLLDSIPSAVHAKSRITQPMVRQGWLKHGPGGNREKRGAEPFVPVSWERALQLVADELQRVRDTHGSQAIFGGSYGWSSAGRFHHAKSQLRRFLTKLGGFTDHVQTYSVAAGITLTGRVLGKPEPYLSTGASWQSIIGNTRLMVMFGGLPLRNTMVGPGGASRHTVGDHLREAGAAGVEFINISPSRNDQSALPKADWWPIRPNTDTALMLGLAHTLVSEDLHDTAFLQRCTTGFQPFQAYMMGETDGQPKSAEWAASITEIPAERIRELARRMAAERTLVCATFSLQRADHGEQPFWMVITLAAMLGQIGLPGGGFSFAHGSMAGTGDDVRDLPRPTLPTGINPVSTYIPVARITDMLLHPGETYAFDGETRTYPDIRLIYWCGGNPFHHHQDINRLIRGWRKPDTVIVNDPWWTATARHADIVLPATTTLERNDIGSYHRDRFTMVMEQALPPQGQARSDYQIFSGLAEHMGFGEAFTEGRDEMDWLRHLYQTNRKACAKRGVEMPTFEAFWEKGYFEAPPPDTPHVLLADFREDPAAHKLPTPSGKIEIFSETIAGFGYTDCPGHPAWLEPAEWLGSKLAAQYPLHLISSQPATRLHSQMDCGSLSQDRKIQGREPMWMHTADAAARGLKEGDVARVFNDRGALLAGVRLTDELRPGVVQLPTGAWYDPIQPGEIGSLEAHGNPNVLTLDKGTSQLAQGPISHSTLVQVEPHQGELPEITVFRPPPTVDAEK